jgi:hypothetical protein
MVGDSKRQDKAAVDANARRALDCGRNRYWALPPDGRPNLLKPEEAKQIFEGWELTALGEAGYWPLDAKSIAFILKPPSPASEGPARNGQAAPHPARRVGSEAGPRNQNREDTDRNGNAPPSVEIFTADLRSMELPEPKWAVEGILPDGLSLLAGKPKLGKSWKALNLALAVATGGVALGSIHVECGDVLYLALEDTKRRLKDRISKLAARQELKKWPTTLHFARDWPRQDKGGLYALIEWLNDHRTARLVVIDTWPRFRPFRARGRDNYEEDYQHAADVKVVADKFGVAILALAHCRNLDATDPLDEVSGTLGLTGAADGVAVLKRERGQHDATLFITGRDIDEREIALRWDPQYALWSILGDAEEYRISKERSEVIDLLKKSGKPLGPKDVADLLGKQKQAGAVKKLLWTMAKDGQLDNRDGKYTIGNPGNRSNPGEQIGNRGRDDGASYVEELQRVSEPELSGRPSAEGTVTEVTTVTDGGHEQAEGEEGEWVG